MPAYYDQTQALRRPVLAEDAGVDWQQMERQQQQSQAKQEEQIRRTGDLAAQRWGQIGEDARAMVAAPAVGMEAYQQAQDRQQRRQAQSEESQVRQQQIAGMERQAALDKQFGTRKAQAEIGSLEAGTRAQEASAQLAEADIQKSKWEMASLAKWNAPGSAKDMFPEYQQMMAQHNLPADTTAAEFVRALGPRMNIAQFKQVQDEMKRAEAMWPLQLRQANTQLAATQQAIAQGNYAFDRTKLSDQVSDIAKMVAMQKSKAATDQDAAKMMDATLQTLDPKIAAYVNAEVKSNEFQSRLQNKLAQATLDPVAAAREQQATADVVSAISVSKQVLRLANLKTQYQKASNILWDDAEADTIRQQIADIADRLEYPNLANDIRSGVSRGATVDKSITRLLSIVGGQAISAARGPNATKSELDLADTMERELTLIDVPVTDKNEHVSAGALKALRDKAKGTPKLPPANFQPTTQPQQPPAGRLDQRFPNQQRQAVPGMPMQRRG